MILLFTTNPDTLQSLLDELYVYSLKWGLKINVSKTKICIFEKRKSRHNFVWSINDENIEIVDSFCYLGVKFWYTGNFTKAVN